MTAEAQRMVGAVARRFSTPDISVETQVLRERAATAILDQAAQNFDLIVLGNRGRGPFESAVLGSVSAEVANASRHPVLVARRDRIKRILLGVDGSDDAAACGRVVRRWSILHGAQVRVLSVADADPQWNPWLTGRRCGRLTWPPGPICTSDMKRWPKRQRPACGRPESMRKTPSRTAARRIGSSRRPSTGTPTWSSSATTVRADSSGCSSVALPAQFSTGTVFGPGSPTSRDPGRSQP